MSSRDVQPRTPLPRGLFVVAGLFFILGVAAGAWTLFSGVWMHFPFPGDLNVYRVAANWAFEGRDPYQDDFLTATNGLGWLYTPFALLALAPLHFVPYDLIPPLWNLFAEALPLAVIVALFFRPLLQRVRTRRGRLFTGIALVGLLFLTSPIANSVHQGQINTVLVAALLFDLAAPDSWRGWRRFRLPQGVVLGLATAIKLVPGLGIVYLLLRRQFKAAFTAMGTVVSAWGLAWAVFPVQSTWFFLHGGLFRATEPGRGEDVLAISNQSLWAMVGRAVDLANHHPKPFIYSLAAIAAIGGLLVAHRLAVKNETLMSVAAVSLTIFLIGPMSWIHSGVVFTAVLGILIGNGRNVYRMLTASVLFFLISMPPLNYHYTPFWEWGWTESLSVLAIASLGSFLWLARSSRVQP